MFPRGHAGISLIINIPLLMIFADTFPINIFCTILIMWLSVTPDIDISSKLFFDKIEHRGVTHTIEFILLFSVLFNTLLFFILYITELEDIYNIYLFITPFIGLLSHMVTDIFDTHGVKISYLLSQKTTNIPIIKDNSDDMLNNITFFIGVILTILFIVIKYM